MADAIRADRGEFLVDPTVGDTRLHSEQSFKSARNGSGTALADVSGSCSASNSAPEPSVSACSALLRQGTRNGWNARSYHRVAAYFDYTNPIAAGMWAGFARGVR